LDADTVRNSRSIFAIFCVCAVKRVWLEPDDSVCALDGHWCCCGRVQTAAHIGRGRASAARGPPASAASGPPPPPAPAGRGKPPATGRGGRAGRAAAMAASGPPPPPPAPPPPRLARGPDGAARGAPARPANGPAGAVATGMGMPGRAPGGPPPISGRTGSAAAAPTPTPAPPAMTTSGPPLAAPGCGCSSLCER